MVNFSIFTNNPELVERFKQNAQIVGITFIVLGLLGIFFPEITSLTSAIFFGWLLLFSGFLVGWHTWYTNKKDWLGWFKFVIFTVTGVLVILNPLPGVITLGILFSAYFFVDAISSVSLAFSIRPQAMWWMSLLNGVLSLVLGIIFLLAIDNPIKTLWLVGLFIGISLFFDGIMLLSFSNSIKEENK